MDQVTYEIFEVIMDRLEKEWFDLVGNPCDAGRPSFNAPFVSDEANSKTRYGAALRGLLLCYL